MRINATLSLVILILIGYVFIVPALPRLEGSFMPVAANTTVTRIDQYSRPGWSIIEGQSLKRRDCSFLAIRWYLGRPGAKAQAQVQFLETTKTRTPGHFNWGEWAVQLTEEQLRGNSFALVDHECHSVWPTTSLFWSSNPDTADSYGFTIGPPAP